MKSINYVILLKNYTLNITLKGILFIPKSARKLNKKRSEQASISRRRLLFGGNGHVLHSCTVKVQPKIKSFFTHKKNNILQLFNEMLWEWKTQNWYHRWLIVTCHFSISNVKTKRQRERGKDGDILFLHIINMQCMRHENNVIN